MVISAPRITADSSSIRIGFGGGCHWCTEAVFQALRGVSRVEQGFIASTPPMDTYSEAVIVHADTQSLPLAILIEIHLRTHASTSQHALRGKYRSAIYAFDEDQALQTRAILVQLQDQFAAPLVTQVLPFYMFKASQSRYRNYYNKRPERPFCKTYIEPKLSKLRQHFAEQAR